MRCGLRRSKASSRPVISARQCLLTQFNYGLVYWCCRYIEAADTTWGETKPTLQETRVHAKCLRSLPLVRDYFRNYRAKKKVRQQRKATARLDSDPYAELYCAGQSSWLLSYPSTTSCMCKTRPVYVPH